MMMYHRKSSSSAVPKTMSLVSTVLLLLLLSMQVIGTFASSSVVLQAEDASQKFGIKVLNLHVGYSGRGYADYQGQGSWIQWNSVDAPSSGEYAITVRYASKNSRKIDLDLDGVSKTTTFPIAATLAWTNWSSETKTLYLSKGSHNIRLVARDSTGPNIDRMEVKLISEDTTGREEDDLEDVLELLENQPTPKPTRRPTPSPTPRPTPRPTSKPTSAPVPPSSPTSYPPPPRSDFPEATVIPSNGYLEVGDVVYAPGGNYRVKFNGAGDLVLLDSSGKTFWSAGVSGGWRCFVQRDGNFLIKNRDMKLLWVAHTSGNSGAILKVDDGGQLFVDYQGATLWLAGKPRGTFTGPSSASLHYPIRAAFYYAWYPETWTVNGAPVKFEPTLGKYHSADPAVAYSHVDQLEYAHTELSIVSWWGRDRNDRELLDRARLTLLLDTTLAMNSDLKWSIYHEEERYLDQSPAELRQDLEYIKKWFAWHPAWGYVDERPVIFVYNEGGCEVVDRWMEASNGEWYVVLKVFGGFRDCQHQPDSWHQYSPGHGATEIQPYTFSVSPGFWRADRSEPNLPRLSEAAFRSNVKAMVDSGADWQLITTFNEMGEGTCVEASDHWASSSGYGYYLDALHDIV